MTIEELRRRTAEHALVLKEMSEGAADDDFASHVVLCLKRASFYAGLSELALQECARDIDDAYRAMEATAP